MNWLKKNLFLLLSLAVAILAGRMLLTSHHFYVHDDIQVFRVNEYLNCFKESQIPCRWSTSLGKGYGMPWFNYYPPMIYAIPSLLTLTGLPIITSLNLFMFMTFIVASWGMYLLIRQLSDRDDLAFFGSVLFTLYPFHATNVFLRGVYAENLAWSLTPWVLYLLTVEVKTHRFSKALPLILASIFLTHVISSFLIIGISVIWVFILDYRQFGRLLKSILIGLGIAAFFFVPAMLEKNLVQSDSLITGYYSYLNHFVTLKQLFINYTWNYGSSYWGTPSVEMGYMVGHIHIVLLGMLICSSLFIKSKSKTKKIAIISTLLFILTLFMTHNKSAPIWNFLSPLAYIQFPWRFVGWAAIPLVIAISTFLGLLSVKSSKLIIWLTLPILLIYSYPFFFPREYDAFTDQDYLVGRFKQEQQTKALFDYLPRVVHVVPESGTGTFYFPGWTSPDKIVVDPSTGVIINHPKNLKWRETPPRLLSDIVSLITLSGYLIYLMYNRSYGKNR